MSLIELIAPLLLTVFGFLCFINFVSDKEGPFWIILGLLMFVGGLYWTIIAYKNFFKYKRESAKSQAEFDRSLSSNGYPLKADLACGNNILGTPAVAIFFKRNNTAFLLRMNDSSNPTVVEVASHGITRYDYVLKHHYEGMDPATGALGGGLGGGYLGALIGGAIANGHEQIDELSLIIGIRGYGTFTILLIENYPYDSSDTREAISFIDKLRKELLNRNFFYREIE